MNKLRIGVIVHLDDEPADGGKYSYFNTLLKGINNFNFSPEIEVINIVFYSGEASTYSFNKPAIYIRESLGGRMKQLGKKLTRKKNSTTFTKRNPVVSFLYSLSLRSNNKKTERILQENNIDFVYYLKQQEDILNYPFIATLWDVSHKSTNGFPEHSLNNNYEFREKYYLYQLNKAFLILCESETGAKELKKYYSLYDEKVKVLPFFPGNIINHTVAETVQIKILTDYNIDKEKFFVYPAQFWPHKNHYNLVVAFKKFITEKDDTFKLVLCGSDKGNFKYIQKVISSLSISDKVVIPGFVSNDELYTFYKNAAALTMPTFLGPTNLPLIEAAALRCPVLCSAMEGHRELLGDTALYFEPSDANAICEAMKKLHNKEFREAIAEEAYKHATNSHFNLERSLRKLDDIFLEIKPKRKTWGVDYMM